MKELTEAEKIIVAIANEIEKANCYPISLTNAIELGKKLIAEKKPKPVFPATGWTITSDAEIVDTSRFHNAAGQNNQGNTFYTEELADKEVLRRAARARCIEKITDYELNTTITKLVYPEPVIYRQNNKVRVQDENEFYIDYCNSWTDLMPLVVEHDISLIKLSDGNYAAHKVDNNNGNSLISCNVINDNPQRALVECLLKVLESKNE